MKIGYPSFFFPINKSLKIEVEFNGSALASGIYIYRIKVNDFVISKKMVLLK